MNPRKGAGMALQDMFKGITEKLQTTVSVESVYGEPIVADGKTIIPVARVRYGFGGGFGEGSDDNGSSSDDGQAGGSGGGGGGGVEVTPIGIIEVTPGDTRYISFEDRRRLIRAALVGIALGAIIFRRKRSK